jgi:hypothetical protein
MLQERSDSISVYDESNAVFDLLKVRQVPSVDFRVSQNDQEEGRKDRLMEKGTVAFFEWRYKNDHDESKQQQQQYAFTLVSDIVSGEASNNNNDLEKYLYLNHPEALSVVEYTEASKTSFFATDKRRVVKFYSPYCVSA